MRLASFNVNSIRVRLPHLRRFLARHAPDVLFLQELKCRTEQFPTADLAETGYAVHALGQAGGRNGVAVLSRLPFAVTAEALPGDPADEEARYLEIEAAGIRMAGIYLPNGNSGGAAGFAFKLRWMERLLAQTRAHLDAFRPFAILGDFNVCPTDADLAPGLLAPTDALVHPEVRSRFRALLWSGMTDAAAALGQHPFTYWDYGPAFEANRGLRIDHALLSPELAERLQGFGVDLLARAEEQPSDHAPIWVDLAD
ncbi:MAG: exodeoxyribonuclease III [Rhodovarius sp.]|nr:exodeoxyribonuclease III [Rhodovarius sp.]